jgi:predicted kinase
MYRRFCVGLMAALADVRNDEAFGRKRVMMREPTLFLTVGLPCTGKTTAARRIEIEQKALRLTKDEWMKALYGQENPPSAQGVIEGRLIQIGLRALELGSNVVIDYGLWGRDERSALRQAAADLGAMVEMRYFELTPAEQRRLTAQTRFLHRNASQLRQLDQLAWKLLGQPSRERAGQLVAPTRKKGGGRQP